MNKFIQYWKFFIVLALAVSLIFNIMLYSYWYDHEYPHGSDYVKLTNNTIEFHPDKYYMDEYYYVSFNQGEYYVLGNGVKNRIDDVLDHWNDVFNTTDFLVEKPHSSNATYYFELLYHTEDFPFECSPGSYKQKVLDGFRLSGWGWYGDD